MESSERSRWTYGNFVDKLSNKRTGRYAELKSDNVLKLKSPYNGGSTVTLLVFDDGENVHAILTLSNGVIANTKILIKFDERTRLADMNETIGGWWSTSADSKKRTFSRSAHHLPKNNFFEVLKSSKHLKIELPIDDNGRQVFLFSTAGLDPAILP